MPEPAPGVDRQTQPALDRTRSLVAAWVPVLFPSDQISGYFELVAVDLRALSGKLDVLREEIIGVHTQRRRRVFERGHRDRAGLRMIWSAPGSLTADVIDDVSVLLALVWNIEDVWYRRRASSAHPT